MIQPELVTLALAVVFMVVIVSLVWALMRSRSGRESSVEPVSQRPYLSDKRPLIPQEVLGSRYRVGHELGRGMNAVTYCVEDVKDPSLRLVAKILLTPEEEPRITPESFRRHSERFCREMRNLEELGNSKYVIRVHECRPYALRPFFLMERCDGSLADRLSNGLLEMQSILDCLVDVCLGLSDCHNRKIIHRDLKPANILRYKDRWVLADFGMSLLANEGTVVSVPESLPGTIPYTAPEVMYYNSNEIRTSSDIFSLGVTLKEMLTGTSSWQGKPSDLLRRQAGEARKREVECFDPSIMRMISLQPEDRPQTVVEVARVMTEVFNNVNQIRQSSSNKTPEELLQGIDRLNRVISGKMIR